MVSRRTLSRLLLLGQFALAIYVYGNLALRYWRIAVPVLFIVAIGYCLYRAREARRLAAEAQARAERLRRASERIDEELRRLRDEVRTGARTARPRMGYTANDYHVCPRCRQRVLNARYGPHVCRPSAPPPAPAPPANPLIAKLARLANDPAAFPAERAAAQKKIDELRRKA